MKIVKESLYETRKVLQNIKTHYGQFLDDKKAQEIIADNKKYGGSDYAVTSVLKYIQHLSALKGGATFSEISAFAYYLHGNTDPYCKDNRGYWCTNLYGANNRTGVLDLCEKRGKLWYYDPEKPIKQKDFFSYNREYRPWNH